ncbi:MAG UNVERIFIED_CONTAM: hypothetical protein LVR18_00090 [Planctomycetaceae bacterium]|jgi:hypothetical protein
MSGLRQQLLKGLLTAITLLSGIAVPCIAGEPLQLNPRSRVETVPGSGFWHSTVTPVQWKPEETCIVVCDMWDDHWCKPSAARVNEMAPFMNGVLRVARAAVS